MNEFFGVYSANSDPLAELTKRGMKAAWQDSRVAFVGSSVHVDDATGLVVAGEYVPVGKPLSLAEIAALFERHGPTAGRQIPGMFALAFYRPATSRKRDVSDGELTLLRDPVGARTLYYTGERDACRFAARLRPLGGESRMPGAISLPALRDYLACAYVPGAQTLWTGVLELRPGEALHLPGGRRETYWTPEEGPPDAAEIPLDEYARRLRPLLDEAVAARLPASGPVGVYLSGGVDSSLVTAIAAKLYGGENVHTFAIHFGKDLPNELAFSEMVARHCGTRHTVLELPARLILRHLEETIALLDDPIGDPLTVPNLLLGRAARQVTGTVLNGEGGDPVFGGPKNIPMLLHELYAGNGNSPGEASEAERIDGYFRSYQKCYEDMPGIFSPEARKALAEAPPQAELLTPFLRDDAPGETEFRPMHQYLNRLMQINVALKGADHILTKVNNLTTACGLVGHSPLFDPRIVEAGFLIPGTYKLAGTQEKAVLKQAVADLLPPAILTRPKSGMLVPVQRWFKEEMSRYAKDRLLSRHSRIRPYLNQEIIADWLKYAPMPFPRHGVKLWLILTLELWLRANE